MATISEDCGCSGWPSPGVASTSPNTQAATHAGSHVEGFGLPRPSLSRSSGSFSISQTNREQQIQRFTRKFMPEAATTADVGLEGAATSGARKDWPPRSFQS